MSSGSADPPAVSVVMSVRNGADHLVESVESILGQTLQSFELLIVDDGSTDATTDILGEFGRRDSRVRSLVREHRGLVRSLNEGCAAARAPLIARMDADDVAAAQRLETQLIFLQRAAEVALVGTAVSLIDAGGSRVGELRPPCADPEIRALLETENAFVHSSVMFRREVFGAVGGYREVARYAEDYDLWLRIADVARLANLAETLLAYRIHEGNVTLANLRQQTLTTVAVRAAHQLKRDSGRDLLDEFAAIDVPLIRRLGVSNVRLREAVEGMYIARARAEADVGRLPSAVELLGDGRRWLCELGLTRHPTRIDIAIARFRFAQGEHLSAGLLVLRSLCRSPARVVGMFLRGALRSLRRFRGIC